MRNHLVTAALLLIALAAPARATEFVLASGASHEPGSSQPARFLSTLAVRDFSREGLVTEASLTGERGSSRLQLSAFGVVRKHAYIGGGVTAQLPVSADQLSPASAPARLGYHLGGGFMLPLTAEAGLDLSARYVFLDRRSADVGPDRFASSFWTLTLGVAFRI